MTCTIQAIHEIYVFLILILICKRLLGRHTNVGARIDVDDANIK